MYWIVYLSNRFGTIERCRWCTCFRVCITGFGVWRSASPRYDYCICACVSVCDAPAPCHELAVNLQFDCTACVTLPMCCCTSAYFFINSNFCHTAFWVDFSAACLLQWKQHSNHIFLFVSVASIARLHVGLLDSTDKNILRYVRLWFGWAEHVLLCVCNHLDSAIQWFTWYSWHLGCSSWQVQAAWQNNSRVRFRTCTGCHWTIHHCRWADVLLFYGSQFNALAFLEPWNKYDGNDDPTEMDLGEKTK